MTHTIIIAIGAAAIAGGAISGPLDAPVLPRTPTVGSEIHRGADAAAACHPLNAVEAPQAYVECIEDAHNQNRQAMGSGFEAFDAGLYFKARRQFEILVRLTAKDPLGNAALIRSDFDMEDARYQIARDKLGLTDAQVMMASYSG